MLRLSYLFYSSVRPVLLSLLVLKEIEIFQLVSIEVGVRPGGFLLCPTRPLAAKDSRIGIHGIFGS